MSAAVSCERLGRRFGDRWAVRDCTLDLPTGSIVGFVGANGAGKTTLLHLLAGLDEPTEGRISVLGAPPAHDAAALGRLGFLAQDSPVYPMLTVAEHLRLGRALNPEWDDDLAHRRVEQLGLGAGERAGRLSGGQRAQLALTMAMAKRPKVLVLDEPGASLDPLARRDFLADLVELVAERRPTVVLSSHLLTDVERVCDHVVVMSAGRVVVQGDVDDLLASHRLLTGPRLGPHTFPEPHEIISVRHTDRQTTALVRTCAPIVDPRWTVSSIGLEGLVLAYLARPPLPIEPTRLVEVRA
jgi:ABC-2 type transport system ATP-binding protein